MIADRQKAKLLKLGMRYGAPAAALARLIRKYLVPPRVLRWLPNPHHAAGRSRTGGIPWHGAVVARRRRRA